MTKSVKMLCLAGLCALTVVLSSVGSAKAGPIPILYFHDLSVGTDRMGQALTNLQASGFATVTDATSPTDFATKIASGNYQLGIFFEQNTSGPDFDAAFAALGAFVAGGGKGIADDWTRNNAHVAPLGASFTGPVNNNQFIVTDPLLAAGVTNPVNLTNPGWGVFSTDLGGPGIFGAHFTADGSGAIVVGDDGRSIVNGFLNDTFADGPTGVQLFTNEITSLLAPVPEPSTLALFAIGGLAVAGVRRWRRRTNA